MNILVNRHHQDLYWSQSLLFEKRLGWKLFVPYGMEWFDKGYFLMHKHDKKKEPHRYMAQYFLVDEFYGDKFRASVRGCKDYPPANPLTFEQFLDTKIDIIVCTNRENEEPFYRLKEYKPGVKFIRQVGNRLDRVNAERYPNVMFSDKESFETNFVSNGILYHQEFDLDIFRYEPPQGKKNIYAFQHHLENYEEAEELWKQHQRIFPDYNFQSYGKGNDGGYIYPKRDVADKMREADFIWQVKDWDGYSHIIHNSFAVGRPMIVRRDDIKGKIFEPLFDETTCVFTDEMEKIRKVDINEYSVNCHQRFKETVNFDREFEVLIKPFLENLR